MTIRRLVQVLFGGLLVLALSAAVLIAFAVNRRRQLVDLQERRFQSYKLADQLRRSSDDLTRFVRLYVFTGDPRYETDYRMVRGIRDGTSPRPERYEQIFWDLYLDQGRPPRPSGPPVALLTLMSDAGFTAEELDSLKTALSRSVALTAIEDEAFHAMHGEFRDSAGRFIVRRRPDTVLARRLVLDSAYVHQKATIMAPIDGVLGSVTERTERELDHFLAQTRVAFIKIESLLALFLLLTAASYPLVRARILKPVARLRGQTLGLAGDLDRLANAAERIAEGDLGHTFSARTAPIRSTRADEIGDLSRVHDSMLGRLVGTGTAIASMTGDLSAARRQAEKAQEFSEQRFESIFQASPVALVVTDRETGEITAANDAMARLVGLPTSEALLGRTTLELGLWRGDAELRRRTIPVVQSQNREVPTRLPLQLPSGEIRTIEAMASGYQLEGRSYILGSLQDITERISLEEQLRLSQKMQALGTLAGGIAHDFNNILTAINGNAELALEDSTDDAPVHRSLLDIRKAGRRAKDLVRQILLFSRREESRREAMDLAPVVEEAVRLLRTSLPKSITIVTELAAGRTPVLADATQVHQIMMNLGTNAGHAMAEKGTMTIRLDHLEIGPGHLEATRDLKAGPYLRLSVADTGTGMPSETLARIFEPFFTTKGAAGTGLGLSVVHGIVRDHEGAIAVESTPGHGTTFLLYFPVTSERQAVATSAAAPRAKGAGQHILLVDDEEALVDVTSRILERLGYRCTSFCSAPEALTAFRADPARFDAIITDVSMPLMNGLELALHAKDINSEIPIALATGAPEDRDLAERAGITMQFRKPMSMDELAEGVARLLRGAARGGW